MVVKVKVCGIKVMWVFFLVRLFIIFGILGIFKFGFFIEKGLILLRVNFIELLWELDGVMYGKSVV